MGIISSCVLSIASASCGRPAPTPVVLPPGDGCTTVMPDERVEVRVEGHPEWSTTTRVAPDGTIELACGRIKVFDLSERAAEETAARCFSRDGEVRVRFRRLEALCRISVVGQVTHPGSLLLSQAPTLLRAITFAGGLTPHADPSRVYVKRRDRNHRVDVAALAAGEIPDVPLFRGDVIWVPEALY